VKVPLVVSEFVQEGSLFALQDQETESLNIYLLVAEGGGVSAEIGNERVLVISSQAPIAKLVVGRIKGEAILNKGKILTIIDIK